MNSKLVKHANTLYHLNKNDWGDEKVDWLCNQLTYDDILDFAEYVESSILSTERQKEICDIVLRMEDVDKYTKKSLIFYIVRFRDPMLSKGLSGNHVELDYQSGW